MKYTKYLKAALAVSTACLVLLSGCSQKSEKKRGKRNADDTPIASLFTRPTEEETTLPTEEENTLPTEEETTLPTEDDRISDTPLDTGIITDYNWEGTQGGSYLVCETDGTFKYYQYATELTDNYYEGTYEFYRGAEALAWLIIMPQYGITYDEMTAYFERNAGTQYCQDNLVVLVLNNQTCIRGGENTLSVPTITPYYGFVLEEDGEICMDLANMNTANSYIFAAKPR